MNNLMGDTFDQGTLIAPELFQPHRMGSGEKEPWTMKKVVEMVDKERLTKLLLRDELSSCAFNELRLRIF